MRRGSWPRKHPNLHRRGWEGWGIACPFEAEASQTLANSPTHENKSSSLKRCFTAARAIYSENPLDLEDGYSLNLTIARWSFEQFGSASRRSLKSSTRILRFTSQHRARVSPARPGAATAWYCNGNAATWLTNSSLVCGDHAADPRARELTVLEQGSPGIWSSHGFHDPPAWGDARAAKRYTRRVRNNQLAH